MINDIDGQLLASSNSILHNSSGLNSTQLFNSFFILVISPTQLNSTHFDTSLWKFNSNSTQLFLNWSNSILNSLNWVENSWVFNSFEIIQKSCLFMCGSDSNFMPLFDHFWWKIVINLKPRWANHGILHFTQT